MKDNHYLHTKSKKHPSIDIRDNVSRLGIRKLQALVGLHKFSVSDWGEKFDGPSSMMVSKSQHGLRDSSYKKATTPSQDCLSFLMREKSASLWLMMSCQVRPLEKLTCLAYSLSPTPAPDYPIKLAESSCLASQESIIYLCETSLTYKEVLKYHQPRKMDSK